MTHPSIKLADWLPDDRGVGAISFEAAVFAPNEWLLAQSRGAISLVIGGMVLTLPGLGWCAVELVVLPHIQAQQSPLIARFVPSHAYGEQACDFRPPVISTGFLAKPLVAGEVVVFEPAGLTYTPDQFRMFGRMMSPGQPYNNTGWQGYFARLGLVCGQPYTVELSHPAGFIKVTGCDYALSCELFQRAS